MLMDLDPLLGRALIHISLDKDIVDGYYGTQSQFPLLFGRAPEYLAGSFIPSIDGYSLPGFEFSSLCVRTGMRMRSSSRRAVLLYKFKGLVASQTFVLTLGERTEKLNRLR